MAVCALAFTALIASADEFIQSFSDRSASIIDVMIDVGGAFLGICLVWLVSVIVQRRRAK